MKALLLFQLASTLPLVGLIWLVQVVQYPLFLKIGSASFPEYHNGHMNRITYVVGPLMLVELVTAIWWALIATKQDQPLVWIGVALVLITWLSTAFIQVPLHTSLQAGFNVEFCKRLVITNWIRTFAWTARGVILIYLAGKSISYS